MFVNCLDFSLRLVFTMDLHRAVSDLEIAKSAAKTYERVDIF